MLARIRQWWAARSRAERLLVGIGVPVAAVAALFGARGDKARRAAAAEAEGTDTEGGPGVEAAVGGANILNTGAPGIGADQLAAFSEAFTGELGGLERQFEEFGQSATERAQAEAERQARFEALEEQFQGEVRANTTARTTIERLEAQVAANAADAQRARVRQEFISLFGVPPIESEDTAKWQRRIAAGRANVAKGLTPGGQPKSSSSPSPSSPAPGAARTYTTVRGDTLSAIGSRFGVPWRAILAANPGALSRPGDVRTLKVGYRLTIPAG